MSAVAEATSTTIDLGCGHSDPRCLEMAGKLKAQLDPKYSRGASLMPLDGTVEEWRAEHRTARKRAGRSLSRGYWACIIDRTLAVSDIHAINTSMPERQGRPMSAGYQEMPSYSSNPMVCPYHHVYTYGVFAEDGPLVAYLWLYRCGELALVSSILGHADHLENEVMYLLFASMLRGQYRLGGTVFYNLHNSGTDGLRFYKERVGLQPGNVAWRLT